MPLRLLLAAILAGDRLSSWLKLGAYCISLFRWVSVCPWPYLFYYRR
ncbi:hypothetical protein HMPREF3198_00046 [Winkia neuii]|nr:hypothetical protein HMPREF3198_00046 [Winkia neuii]